MAERNVRMDKPPFSFRETYTGSAKPATMTVLLGICRGRSLHGAADSTNAKTPLRGRGLHFNGVERRFVMELLILYAILRFFRKRQYRS
jgi:hypothetical protein